jgi:hypothetical protein
VISGGRSAGSQVACRTARQLGAHAVLALAYPLLGPGSPAELLATGRPTLVIQGTKLCRHVVPGSRILLTSSAHPQLSVMPAPPCP